MSDESGGGRMDDPVGRLMEQLLRSGSITRDPDPDDEFAYLDDLYGEPLVILSNVVNMVCEIAHSARQGRREHAQRTLDRVIAELALLRIHHLDGVRTSHRLLEHVAHAVAWSEADSGRLDRLAKRHLEDWERGAQLDGKPRRWFALGEILNMVKRAHEMRGAAQKKHGDSALPPLDSFCGRLGLSAVASVPDELKDEVSLDGLHDAVEDLAAAYVNNTSHSGPTTTVAQHKVRLARLFGLLTPDDERWAAEDPAYAEALANDTIESSARRARRAASRSVT